MTTFTAPPYDWPKTRKNGGKIHVFHGENDPYIAFDKSLELSRQLHANFTLIPEGKHLNASAGFTVFEKLLQEIRTTLTQP